MATNILESIGSLFTPNVVSQLSGFIGGNTDQTKSAVTSILPALLGGLIQKTSTPSGSSEIMNLLKNGNFGATNLNNLGSIFEGGSKDQFNGLINAASPVLDSLFGNKLDNMTNAVSKSSGLNSISTSSVLGFLASIVMSFIGSKVTTDNLDSNGLSSMLSGQKNFLSGLIPAGLSSILGFSSLDKTGGVTDAGGSGFKKFLPWLLAIIAAILLLWWWKGCDKNKTTVTKKIDSVKSETKKVDANEIQAPKTGDSMMDSLYANLGKFIVKKLADGTEIIIAAKGIEGNLIQFIEDKTKVADKETWFSFDRILFETGKSNLRPSSALQLANIAAIMKAYPNVEIKIGGYTDNTGNPQANMKLSQERANEVMSELVKLGVPAARLKAEGYGEQFPVATNDTPEGRAQNRRIDIRITKK